MSFESQAYASLMFKTSTIVIGIISFLLSMILGKFRICGYTMVVVYIINIVVFVPAWPIWKNKKSEWS